MGSKRTIVTLPEEDKIWLESYSKACNVSIAGAIRQGIGRLRASMTDKTYHALLQRSRGVWKKGDGQDEGPSAIY